MFALIGLLGIHKLFKCPAKTKCAVQQRLLGLENNF